MPNDFLARSGWNRPRKKLAHFGQHGEHFDFVEEALRRFHVHELTDSISDFIERLDLKRHTHPPLGAELIDEDRRLVSLGVFKQKSRAAACGAGASVRAAF